MSRRGVKADEVVKMYLASLVKMGWGGYNLFLQLQQCGVRRDRDVLAGKALETVKFILVDQLLSLESGKRIVMAKNVTMAEEYLADHFPGFPVLPGVMMLEGQGEDFAHSLIVLKEARGVRYGTLVSPGQTLTITAEAVEIGSGRSDFKVKGTVNGATAIQARLELSHLNLADTNAAMGEVDKIARAAQRDRWATFMQRTSVNVMTAGSPAVSSS